MKHEYMSQVVQLSRDVLGSGPRCASRNCACAVVGFERAAMEQLKVVDLEHQARALDVEQCRRVSNVSIRKKQYLALL